MVYKNGQELVHESMVYANGSFMKFWHFFYSIFWFIEVIYGLFMVHGVYVLIDGY